MNYEIQRVYPPTQKQREHKIFGSCTLAIKAEDGTIAAFLNNITVRMNGKTKEHFLAAPGYTFGEGEEKKHRNYFSILPLGDDEALHDTQKKRMRSLVAQVLSDIDTAAANQGSPPAAKTESAAPAETEAGTKAAQPW